MSVNRKDTAIGPERSQSRGEVVALRAVPDVHLPHLDEHDEDDKKAAPHTQAAAMPAATRPPRSRSLARIVLEVALIATGVFLGLLGEQWRESAHRRELAEASLRRFRAEIVSNRKAIEAVKDYHVTTKKIVDAYFAADPKKRQRADVQISGIQPPFLEHTAWDLALATQSLVYIDPQLAFGLSRIYNVQQEVSGLTSGVLQAMYLLNPTQNLDAFLGAVAIYYGDVVMIEPKLVKMYDEILPQIDRALGESPARNP